MGLITVGVCIRMSEKTPPPPPGFPPLPPPPPIDDSNDKEIKQKNDDLDTENTDISNITDDLLSLIHI